jgi:EAL domain-containing protein (putative c-di-GMP-specific phosphodiesterase class I)
VANSRPGTDYILSPCSLVADGLVKVMIASGMRPVVLSSDATTLPAEADIRRIIIFLPDTPARLLTTLQQAATFLEHSAMPLPMLILSRSPASWLWHTLLHQVIDHRLLSKVRAAASDLPVSSLAAVLQDYILQRYPPLKQLADEEIRLGGRNPGGLTRAELNAILGLLSGDSVNAQAKRCRISHKTLYNQRTAGLKKMVEHHPQLATRFPGSQTKGQKKAPDAALSTFEREFVHAIHCRQIFPVFQPIADGRIQLKGIEILSRWRQNGKLLLPGDFLPQVRSEYAWLVLTAFVLREAVQNINQYPGEFYFSVNIPAAIASNENLIRMIETARQQLHQPHMSRRLVLEFAETQDLNQQSHIADNITHLRKQGFTIMLDDCFSHNSVMFPVRSFSFSAYKLDKRIINDMQHDPHAMALIKSLLYYCRLTGSRCVAGGVNNLDIFNRLKALGIDRFQGNFISPPVERENINDVVQRLLSDRDLSLIAG